MVFPARRRDRPSGAHRPEWYDRNPIVPELYYVGDNVAPHTVATRFTYTVPTGWKAMLETATSKVTRRTAAGVAGKPYGNIAYTKYLGSPVPIIQACLLKNAVGDQDSAAVGTTMVMLEGDNISGRTADDSTGGTVDYLESVKVTLFAA